ncbi:DUF1700 domain-containing protein [Anaerosporobacter sp.]
MNRQEFLNELENLLINIPSSDRQEAIQYYQDYFEDAGVENEEQVIRELGTPERVAAIIQEDLRNEATVEKGEFTEKGYHNPAFEKKNADAVVKVESPNYQNTNQGNGTQSFAGNGFNTGQNTESMNNQQQKEPTYVYEYSKIPKIVLIIGLILFLPVGLPLLGAAFGIIVAIISVAFSLVVAFGAISFGLTLGGVITLVGGIAQIITFPMTAFLTSGIGLVLIGIGLLFAILTRYCAMLIPLTFRGIVAICRLPFKRRVMA